MRVLTICGSLPSGSLNLAVLEAVRHLAPYSVEVVSFTGMGELPHFNPDLEAAGLPAGAANLRAQVSQADALLISSPEYAHGMPGSLKNLLDWLVGDETFAGKPVALVNTSPRATHAQAQLAEVLTTMSARLVSTACVTLPLLARPLDAAGIIRDAGLSATLRDALKALACFIGEIEARETAK